MAFKTGDRVRFTGIKGIVDDRIYIVGASFPADGFYEEMVEIGSYQSGAFSLAGAACVADLEAAA